MTRFAVLAGVLLVATTSFAQEDSRDREARMLFQAGELAFNEGRFENALESFHRAHALTQRPELLFNIGTCQERLERYDEALQSFRAYLTARPDAPNANAVAQRIRILEVATTERDDEPDESLPAESVNRTPVNRTPGAWTLMAAGIASTAVGVTLLALVARDINAVENPGMSDGSPPRWEDFEDRHERTVPRSAAGYALVGLGVALTVVGAVIRVSARTEVELSSRSVSLRTTF